MYNVTIYCVVVLIAKFCVRLYDIIVIVWWDSTNHSWSLGEKQREQEFFFFNEKNGCVMIHETIACMSSSYVEHPLIEYKILTWSGIIYRNGIILSLRGISCSLRVRTKLSVIIFYGILIMFYKHLLH